MGGSARTALGMTAALLALAMAVPGPAAAQAFSSLDDWLTAEPPAEAEPPADTEPYVAPASPVVEEMAAWVRGSGDNHGLPFVIVDKVAAEVFVYAPDGRLRGAAPALLGLAIGDDSVPGIGDQPLSTITPDERTTPAGRFIARFGPSKDGEVLWVDYADAISMHVVITSNPREQRMERLMSPTPDDNRISFGCINLPAGFYEDVVRRSFTGTNGVVYILPEVKTLAEVFPAFGARMAAAEAREPAPPRDIATLLDRLDTGAGASPVAR
ncbi:L,D-transpeptidase [Phenylobacterium sp.]|uniref:L,D-transpeptidase n=1 Tax=Phenylobacterium sp. TaxID=1871053 RepID=UPI0035B0A1F3